MPEPPHGPQSAAEGSPADHSGDAVALVRAYATVTVEAERLPPVVLVRPGERWAGGLGRIVPRPRWFLRFFIVEHARRTLDAIRRHLLMEAATRPEDDADEVQRRSVSMYLDAVASHRRALFTTSLLLLTVAATRLLLMQVPGAIRLFGGMQEQAADIRELLTAIEGAIRNPTNPDMLVARIAEWPVRTVAFVVTTLCTALYLVLRPLVPAFKLKRTLFNLHPEVGDVRSAPARYNVRQATGLYHTERSILDRLGVHRATEPAWDLFVPALILPAGLFLAVLMVDYGRQHWVDPRQPLLSNTIATALVIVVLMRLAWLSHTWTLRRLPVDDCKRRSPAVLRGSLRDPWTVGFLVLMAACFSWSVGEAAGMPTNPTPAIARFLFVLFVFAPMWCWLSWQVGEALHEHIVVSVAWATASAAALVPVGFGTSMRPGAVALAFAAIGVTGIRLRRAEATVRPARGGAVHPALLAMGLVLPPLLVAHVQHVLNGLDVPGAVAGDRIADAPATSDLPTPS